MHYMVKFLAIPVLLGTTFFMHGCEQKKTAQQPEAETSADDRIMKELASEPVKSFAKTAQDPDDIRALRDYDQRFTAVSDEMEDELMELKSLRERQLLSENHYRELSERWGNVFEADMGAEAIRKIVARMDLDQMAKEQRHEIRSTRSKQRRKKVPSSCALSNRSASRATGRNGWS